MTNNATEEITVTREKGDLTSKWFYGITIPGIQWYEAARIILANRSLLKMNVSGGSAEFLCEDIDSVKAICKQHGSNLPVNYTWKKKN